MEITNKHWNKSKIEANEDIINLFKKFQPKIEFKPNQKIILFGSSTHSLKNPKEINSGFFQNNRITLGKSPY